jgi:H+/Cl- antiporter ClcA
VVKLLSMTLGIAAGLPMGKDGPNVHISACAPKLEEITGKSWEIYRQIHYK